MVTTSACAIDSVIVSGREQPSLSDNGSVLIDEFDRLLGTQVAPRSYQQPGSRAS